MSRLLKKLSVLKTLVEQHLALWSRAWQLMHTSSVFLPYDPTYYALKYLAQSEERLILDIGANQGISALSFHKICPKHQIIKIDAERHEHKVLAGARETLTRHMPTLIFEACHGDLSEITRILSGLEYEIFSYAPEKDFFTPFDPSSGIAYISGLRNLIAVSRKTQKMIVLRRSKHALINII